MIGKAVERQGIIRHGAKMISAVADATVPKICVVLRKAYGAGLYAMCGPGFEPDVTIALPQAMIAVMGAEAAVNAVFANKIAEKPEAERAAYVEQLREEYRADIDLLKLAREPARRRGGPGRRPARRADPAAGGRGEQDRQRLRAAPLGSSGVKGRDGEIGSGAFADVDSGGRGAPHPRRHAAGRPRAGRARRRASAACSRRPSRRRPTSRASAARSWTATRCAAPTSAAHPRCGRSCCPWPARCRWATCSRARSAAGEAVAIATGGWLPAGADTVVMVEHVASARRRRARRAVARGRPGRQRRRARRGSRARRRRVAGRPAPAAAGSGDAGDVRDRRPSTSTAARASPCCRPATSCAIRPRRRARARCATPTRPRSARR